MVGRPLIEARQIAIELGLPTYVGTTHARCGTNERYASGGGCVHCARVIATEQREARKFLKLHAKEYRAEENALDNSTEIVLENENEDDAEARRQASIDELM